MDRLPTENELKEKYKNGLNSRSIYYDETKDWNTNYEEWKYNTYRKSVDDLNWDSDGKNY